MMDEEGDLLEPFMLGFEHVAASVFRATASMTHQLVDDFLGRTCVAQPILERMP